MTLIVAAQTPNWFHGVDIVFEFFSLIIAFLIASVAWKAYRLSSKRRYLAFGAAFFLLGVSFLARMVSASLVYLEVLRDFRSAMATDIAAVEPTFLLGRFIYITITFAAYLMLVAVAMRVEERRTLALLFSFLAILAWLAHASPNTLLFHFINLLLLVFIAGHFLHNYHKKRSKNSLLTLVAFLMIMFEMLFFFASNFEPRLYIGAYLFRLVGYVFLATALLKVTKT